MFDIQLPMDWQDFRTVVLDRVKAYCRANIWPWEYDLFTSWLSNFDNGTDEYIALHLLDSLIVRSEKMAESGFSRLFNSELLQYLISIDVFPQTISLSEWDELLKNPRNSPIQFLPVRMEGDEGESGGAIFRQLSSLINTNRLSMRSKDTKAVVLIDDLLGSGDQISDYLMANNLCSIEPKIIYCPLIAMESGMVAISDKYSDLKILPVERVGRRHSLFDLDKSKFRNDPINPVQNVLAHYRGMKARYASQNMPFWLGRDDSALPIAFEWGCPNQSPSIFWMQNSPIKPEWRQLFSRRA
ncbi:hypothetical protein [Lacimicrobium alkaliphilum]|uniref:PRTase-CE domain-containing protein n=1 Tax=Lacimicrobium alkaliphilum TaxID=1526571 RepID=A0A0U3B0P8_9ALTE|nr:hypothetical protein [Lacimicrobium alkaliphilum]ALS97097.1 hypothetical protein AT746_01575 [Lacimicrobium alkaliphilum]